MMVSLSLSRFYGTAFTPGKGCLGAVVGFVLYQKQYVNLLLMAGEPGFHC